MASYVTPKKQQYEGHQLLDEFLLYQVVPSVNILKLRTLASCLGVSQTEYDRITAPNTFTQDEQIHKVSVNILILPSGSIKPSSTEYFKALFAHNVTVPVTFNIESAMTGSLMGKTDVKPILPIIISKM